MLQLSFFYTTAHVIEELGGPGGPIWSNFGRIVGVRLPTKLGFILFSVLLTILLWVLAVAGYLYESKVALSLLLGARLGDSIISHWGLRILRLSVPNPGVWTTSLYALEAVLILSIYKGLSPWWALVGGLFFAAVLPSMWLAGRIVPAWRIPDHDH